MGTIAVVCKIPDEIFCEYNACVKHCCPFGHYYHSTRKSCQRIQNAHLEESLYNPTFEDKHLKNTDNLREIFNGIEMMCNQTLTYDITKYDIKFWSNGEAEIEGKSFEMNQYCVNHIENITENGVRFFQNIISCADNLDPCEGDYPAWKCLVELQVLPGLFTLSMIFLGFLLIYLWKTQRDKLFGWLMISAILMLFIFYLFLSIIKVAGTDSTKINRPGYNIRMY